MRNTILVFFLLLHFCHFAQINRDIRLLNHFSKVEILADTSLFSTKKDVILHRNESHLAFEFQEDDQTIEVRMYPNELGGDASKTVSLSKSEEFVIIDSIQFVNDSYFRFKVRFKSISKSEFIAFVFEVNSLNQSNNFDLKLFPFAKTRAQINIDTDELYIGEEKRFEIISNQIHNLKLSGEWIKETDFEYRLYERNGNGFLAIVPTVLGNKSIVIPIESKKPMLSAERKINYLLTKQTLNFSIKGSRLSFLKIDKREIIKENNYTEGIEIQLDNNRNLQINKTYRIENREDKGGPLIAELFTVRRLSNDKVLCLIRPYQLHNSRNGYLFIKDNDNPLFITNLDILPELKIHKMSILREGKNWTTDNSVFPGETIEVKLEGEGLAHAKFDFEDVVYMILDSTTSNEKLINYKIKIPVDIKKRTLELYHHTKKVGNYLQIIEFQKPRSLDFVFLNYGDTPKEVKNLVQPVLFNGTVRDIVLSFKPNLIDEENHLFGKQFLEVDIRILGPRGELIEMQRIEQIEVCPGENSPRFAFYDNGNCNRQDISINAILSRKTHSLDHWSKIEVTIRHKRDKYATQGYTQKVEIYLQKLTTFDVDVSFPAGLVIKKVGVDGFPGLGGISLAMLAQFSFYDKDKIRRLKPYKVGAGFLAQNAFNFNPENTDRDLGIVVLGSVYPTRKDSKLSFPLYGGFGYFLNQDKFFYLIGPGIRISL
jgi:hypothetical protein